MTVRDTVTAPAGRPSVGYMPGLDGARALAIVLVVVSHIAPGVFLGGGLGVDLFFVLSGYLITGILVKERARTGTIRLKRFYLRRFIRLYPELLVVVAVMGAIGVFLVPDRREFLVETIGAVTYTTVIPFDVLQWSGSRVWTHTWTLSIEELFYLVWPLLLIVSLRHAWVRWHASSLAIGLGVAALLVALAISLTSDPYPSVFFRMGAMAIGGGCAMLPNRDWFRSPTVAWAGLVVFLAAVAASSFDTVPYGLMFLPAAVGATLLVVHLSTAETGPLVAFFTKRPLVYVGQISYSWYLWHFPTLVYTSWVMPGGHLAHALVWIPLSFLAAAVTHRFLAPRIDRWKRAVR